MLRHSTTTSQSTPSSCHNSLSHSPVLVQHYNVTTRLITLNWSEAGLVCRCSAGSCTTQPTPHLPLIDGQHFVSSLIISRSARHRRGEEDSLELCVCRWPPALYWPGPSQGGWRSPRPPLTWEVFVTGAAHLYSQCEAADQYHGVTSDHLTLLTHLVLSQCLTQFSVFTFIILWHSPCLRVSVSLITRNIQLISSALSKVWLSVSSRNLSWWWEDGAGWGTEHNWKLLHRQQTAGRAGASVAAPATPDWVGGSEGGDWVPTRAGAERS